MKITINGKVWPPAAFTGNVTYKLHYDEVLALIRLPYRDDYTMSCEYSSQWLSTGNGGISMQYAQVFMGPTDDVKLNDKDGTYTFDVS